MGRAIASSSRARYVLSIVLLALAASRAAADVKVYGERFRLPADDAQFVRTYAVMPNDHDSSTAPQAVGVEITNGFNQQADTLRPAPTIIFPVGPGVFFNYTSYENRGIDFPAVGRNPFKSLFWSYNFHGHPGVGVYDKAHYDFHFQFTGEEAWWRDWYPETAHGPCVGANNATFHRVFKPMPADCWPGPLVGKYTAMGDFVWGMGQHLFPLHAPEFSPVPQQFNHTLIIGADNGTIINYEPMITQEYISRPNVNYCMDLTSTTPRRFNTARYVPTRLCYKSGKKSFRAEFRQFVLVPGGCATINSGPMMGYYPTGANARPVPAGCSVPAMPTAGR